MTVCRLNPQEAFMRQIDTGMSIVSLFDRLPDIVFSIKDLKGRYVLMSEAAVVRCGLPNKQLAVGMTAFDLFPSPMAARYARQDAELFRSGKPIIDNLDLTLYRDRSSGWCLTTKEPLRNANGEIIGLACISKDLTEPGRAALVDTEFADTIDYMHANLGEPLRVEELARRARLSMAQFDRRMKKVFQLSAGQYLMKIRIDTAARLLAESDHSIAKIAQITGFCDQSNFSRRFRLLTSLSPLRYRQLVRFGQAFGLVLAGAVQCLGGLVAA